MSEPYVRMSFFSLCQFLVFNQSADGNKFQRIAATTHTFRPYGHASGYTQWWIEYHSRQIRNCVCAAICDNSAWSPSDSGWRTQFYAVVVVVVDMVVVVVAPVAAGHVCVVQWQMSAKSWASNGPGKKQPRVKREKKMRRASSPYAILYMFHKPKWIMECVGVRIMVVCDSYMYIRYQWERRDEDYPTHGVHGRAWHSYKSRWTALQTIISNRMCYPRTVLTTTNGQYSI